SDSTILHLIELWAREELEVSVHREGKYPAPPSKKTNRECFEQELRLKHEFPVLSAWVKDKGIGSAERNVRLFLLGVCRFDNQIAAFPRNEFRPRLIKRVGPARRGTEGSDIK